MIVPGENLQRLLAKLRREVDHVGRARFLALERRRPRWERLPRCSLLARHCGLGHRPVIDGPQRPAGDAVEHEDESLLGDLGHGAHSAAAHNDVDQVGSRGDVVVPKSVAHELKVPHPPASGRLETDEAVGEQVVAVTLAAIVIVRRRAERQIDVAELLVGAHDRPHVHPADRAPRLTRPRLVAELTYLRDGVEDPSLRAGAYIERTDVPRRHVEAHGPALDR